jgi:hypothetical protein
MKSPQELALQRAQDYARDRGWRQEPLTWEEVAVLTEVVEQADDEYFHIDDVIDRIARVKMSKTARANLASEFGVSPEDLGQAS